MTRKLVVAQESKSRTNSPVDLAQLEPRSKIWIEKNGGTVLSDWRVMLLGAIDRTGSLAKAAEDMGVPYRSAWQKIKESEERLGIRLIATRSGGAAGGNSELTEAAYDLLRRYHQLTDGLAELVDRRFKEVFG
jgi:molybdate transport system regulatory protein